MELQFRKQEVTALQCPVCQVQNLEQTQELRLPEGSTGVERILGCWGQVLIRSKEWRRDSVRLAGGVMIWLLYQPEDGAGPRRLETWIPFQMDWDLPENLPEGQISLKALLRFADARSVSAGKVLIRVGVAVLARCWTEETEAVYQPEAVPEDVRLLRESYPLRLPREAGEKPFQLQETLALPASVPRPEQLVYYRMEPAVSDQRVMGSKVVFRGSGNLHVLFLTQDGQPQSWDFELPFSQYGELEGSYSPDAQCEVTMAVTSLELEGDEEGKLHLKAGLTGQYVIDDRQLVELVTDAWSPCRPVELERTELKLTAILDSRRERVEAEEKIGASADAVLDAICLPDFPGVRREGDSVTMEETGLAQLLVLEEGGLRGITQRLEGQLSMKADGEVRLRGVPVAASLDTGDTGDGLLLRWETVLQVTASAGQGISMVTGLTLGEAREPDPGRPALILRRAGRDRLWDIAKASGSTVEAIMEANGLEEQPEPGKLLLIPVL